MTSSVVSMARRHDEGGVVSDLAVSRITAPSVLGMYAFATATFMVAARIVHWYGNAHSPLVLFPLVLIFGGLAQFYAGTWAFQTRDVVAVAMHGTWGSFWAAYGILEILYATGRVVRPQGAFPELGFWFVAMAAITWSITVASRGNRGTTIVLALLAIGSTLAAIGELIGLGWVRVAAGYFLMASALMAWYVASVLIMRVRSVGKAQPAPLVEHNESARVA